MESAQHLVVAMRWTLYPKLCGLLFADALQFFQFIGTVQICTPMFDVNFVMDNYGLSGVFVEACLQITLIELINAFLLRNAAADPCSLFYDYVKGRHSIFNLSLLLSVQFVGGYSSFLIARQFFSLGLHWAHIDALNEECSADLTVAVLYGSIVEALGLFAGKVAEFVIDEKLLHRNYISLAIATCSALITVLGINLTGMYANPIVAWALTFNCGGVTILGHFIVYWLSPIFAFFASKAAFGDDDEEIDKKEA